ncbi:hypothetical protein HYG77_32945 (plasmid) [Rhodococcus sp. ZPP]|uniref:hypothetical protein n=1 Tax=Rhodococcus sp. ZPP TaxID=2749906 RepID=UPI001AD8777C|nr:hypothetical protein [Rhodococcus sp. ZPP]QTJ70363.1 hypothetical protein HYG77_32945 [Rhodococcus sp. ZPP]
MELIFVQHADPATRDVDGGGAFVPGATGGHQAPAVARRLGAEGGWDALYAAGPPVADTAAAIGAATGLTPRSSPATADAVDAVIADHPGQRVLVCACPQVIDEIVRRAFGVAAQVVRSPDPTGITRIMASRAGHREIVSLNDTAHLRVGEPFRNVANHDNSLNHNETGKAQP